MIEVSAARRAQRRWAFAAPTLFAAGLLHGCNAGEAPLAPVTSVVSPAQPGDRASPGAPDASVLPSAGASGGGEGSPPLEATLDAPASGKAASTDAGASERPDAAASDAGEAGAPPSNDCCSTSLTGGCTDVTVAACVCEGDPFCCSTEYDTSCVTEAISRCGLDCDDRAATSDCCSTSDVPGCTVPDVEACICDIDPVCCVFRFDQNCINLGISQCGAVCGAADGGT